MIVRRLALAALFAVLAIPALALDYKLGAIEIGQPWTRATPPTAPTGGGFLSITNKGTTPDRLIAVKSPAADKVEIHEMKMDGNVMRMRELEKGIEIPPGATVELKPGGLHIMFMGLKAPFAKDAKVPATLVFEKAGSIDVELQVAGHGGGRARPRTLTLHRLQEHPGDHGHADHRHEPGDRAQPGNADQVDHGVGEPRPEEDHGAHRRRGVGLAGDARRSAPGRRTAPGSRSC